MSPSTRFRSLLPLVCRAVALAMGVAVVVLTTLGTQKDPAALLPMLGLGLALLALAALSEGQSHDR